MCDKNKKCVLSNNHRKALSRDRYSKKKNYIEKMHSEMPIMIFIFDMNTKCSLKYD